MLQPALKAQQVCREHFGRLRHVATRVLPAEARPPAPAVLHGLL